MLFYLNLDQYQSKEISIKKKLFYYCIAFLLLKKKTVTSINSGIFDFRSSPSSSIVSQVFFNSSKLKKKTKNEII
jgi:hypothetical protein